MSGASSRPEIPCYPRLRRPVKSIRPPLGRPDQPDNPRLMFPIKRHSDCLRDRRGVEHLSGGLDASPSSVARRPEKRVASHSPPVPSETPPDPSLGSAQVSPGHGTADRAHEAAASTKARELGVVSDCNPPVKRCLRYGLSTPAMLEAGAAGRGVSETVGGPRVDPPAGHPATGDGQTAGWEGRRFWSIRLGRPDRTEPGSEEVVDGPRRVQCSSVSRRCRGGTSSVRYVGEQGAVGGSTATRPRSGCGRPPNGSR